MIILDTNVVSELMRDSQEQRVLAWLDAQPTNRLFVTTITQAEILTGIALLPDGRRRHGLAEATERVFAVLFAGRILPFGSNAARAYATIFARRRTTGRPIGQADCQIAAIASSREAAIATRHVADFEGVDVALLNPWTKASNGARG